DTKYISAIGFSFGALPAIANIKELNELILLMPFVNYNVHNKNDGEDLNKTFNFINNAFPLTYRLNKNKLLAELKEFNYESFIKKNKTMLKLVYGEKDKNIPKEEIDWIKNNFNVKFEIGLNIDHSCNLGKENWLRVLK
ncbi:MAG: hypothetical protein PHN56_06030, partial [Candidatus Nanoarchaeia archaeon]|nr:hypothetical protein [Candidatus Nanoarchaeia archaeon]